MQPSAVAAGLKSWRCFKTVFWDTTGRTSRKAKWEGEGEMEQGPQDEEEKDDEDERRQDDEIPGEDVSLLENVTVDKRKIAKRIHRTNSKLLLRERALAGGGCGTLSPYTDRPGDGQPTTASASLPSFHPAEGRRQDEDESEASEWSSGHPDEWSDYTDGQWNLLQTEDFLASVDRYHQPRLRCPKVDAFGHLATSQRVAPSLVADAMFNLELTSSYSRSDPCQFDQTDASENLIDFESDELTLVGRLK